MKKSTLAALVSLTLLLVLACGLPDKKASTPPPTEIVIPASPTETLPAATNTASPIPPTATATIAHLTTPSAPPQIWVTPVYDVRSDSTAPEKRAPYGEAYKYNLFERPFTQEMDYIPEMDIVSFRVLHDENWYYVSFEVVGDAIPEDTDIDYGIEIDLNSDGFGDYLIWAHPPYSAEWDSSNVQVYADKNHDTAGLSAGKSDAPLDGDGYEALVFDGGIGDDPDLAWVRVNAGEKAEIQFAFKPTLVDSAFMMGVVADAGPKDPGKFDYNDRWTEEEAGSPLTQSEFYPLGSLFAVDNTCREAFGFKPTGYEPRLCPHETPTATPLVCTNPEQYHDAASCTAAGCLWYVPVNTTHYVPPSCVQP